jgi:ABC-type multidrug transport system fused ATPase/permease subunit
MNRTLQILSKIWCIFAPVRWALWLSFSLIVMIQVLNLSMPYVSGKALDALVQGVAMNDMVIFVVIVLLIAVFLRLLSATRNLLEVRYIDHYIERHLDMITINKLMDLSIGQHRNQNSGITQSVIGKGQSDLMGFVFSFYYAILPVIIKTVAAVVALLFVNVWLAIVLAIGIAFFLITSLLINKSYYQPIKDFRDSYDNLNKFRTEIVRNPVLIQINSREKVMTEEYGGRAKKHQVKAQNIWSRFIAWIELRGLILPITSTTILAITFWFITQGVMTVGELLIVSAWTSMAMSEIGVLAHMQRRLSQQIVSIGKYMSLLDVEPAIKNSTGVKPDIKGSIEFKNVNFQYPTDPYIKGSGDDKKEKDSLDENINNYALHDINFSINAGERVAFVGQSGSGKSTIMSMILRGYDPESGSICIDGHDLDKIDYVHYRSHIGIVEQNVVLFDNTLRYNILFGVDNPDSVSDEQLHQVIKAAAIDSFMDKLPNGLNTIVGENGVKLSGGEKQRVGIARALMRNPRILILDEATSHLDSLNEKLIKESVDKVSVGRTTIIIAHRLSTVKDAGTIFVVDNGKVFCSGSHDVLMTKCQIYRDLVETQALD